MEGSLPARQPLPSAPVQAALVAAGVAAAVLLGVAAGNPTPGLLTAGLALLGGAVIVGALLRPFVALQVLAVSTVLLLVVDLPSGLGINPFDLLLPCLLAASVLGGVITRERRSEREETDPRARELRRGAHRLAWAVLAFYGVAALSIVAMAAFGRIEPLANSTFTLARGLQGLLLFPLAIWWVRSEDQIHRLIRAFLLGTVLLAVVNAIALGTGAVRRAGMIWFVNQSEAPVGGPNEAASTMLLMFALLAVRQTLAHRVRNLVLIGLVLALLVATSSRSGLLASIAFAAMVMPRARVRWILFAAMAVAVAIPLVPQEYWSRLGRTLVLERGTFEAYTSLIRLYGWKTAWSVFLDNPVLGVGYVAYPYVSDAYGELRIRGNPVDNYYLETAAGMGIVGLIALAVVIVRLFQLGAIVRRVTPVGTLGHELARVHRPLLVGFLIVNLTGNNFVGMVVLGQLALWTGLLVRSGHLALETRSA